MPASFDTTNKIIELTSSIIDLPVFHQELREWESSSAGIVNPTTHKWKALDLGGGAFFYQCDLINDWKLKFTVPGSYVIEGNLTCEIVSVPGVFVERKTSSAYATTSVGTTGPTAASIAAELLSALENSTILAKESTSTQVLAAAKLAAALSA